MHLHSGAKFKGWNLEDGGSCIFMCFARKRVALSGMNVHSYHADSFLIAPETHLFYLVTDVSPITCLYQDFVLPHINPTLSFLLSCAPLNLRLYMLPALYSFSTVNICPTPRKFTSAHLPKPIPWAHPIDGPRLWAYGAIPNREDLTHHMISYREQTKPQ